MIKTLGCIFLFTYIFNTGGTKKVEINAVVDGEIIVANKDGVADFGQLQNWRSEVDGNLVFYIFDILWLDGISLIELPLIQRRV